MKPLLKILLAGLCVTLVTVVVLAQPGSGAGGFGSVGPGGGGGGPTNGQTQVQVSANIAGSAVLQTNGSGTNTTLLNPINRFSSTLTNSFNDFKGKTIADLYVGTTNVGRIESGHAGNLFNIGRDDTLGFLFWGLDDTSSISDTNPKQILGGFDGYGDWYVKQRLYVGGTQLIFDTDNDAPNVTIKTSQSGAELSFERPPTLSGAHISAGSIPMSALNTNVLTVTNQPFSVGQAVVITGTNSSGQPVVKGTNWPSGGGSSIPSVLGIVTNTAGGVLGVSTAVPGTWIAAASIPITAADSTWMSITNAVAITNQPTTIGQALVVVGTNVNGATLVKGTNWPSGGGSQTPWASDINGGTFNLGGVGQISQTNASTQIGLVFSPFKDATYGAVEQISGFTNGVASITTLEPDNLIATATVQGAKVIATGGSVSLIPTNASVVLTSNGVAASLPFGITNSLAGRVQPVVQYYMIDGASGVPVMTCSNEATGVKLIKGKGSLASLTETNWFTLPITSTNTIWRVRDESTGSGASVGIITNWFIGL